MRDEVFRVPGRSRIGEPKARTIDLDGEPWWLLGDVVELRGYPRQLATKHELLKHVDAEAVERVWMLRPSDDHPYAAWVVSEVGRSQVHDVCPVREMTPEEPVKPPPSRRRRRPAVRARGPRPPA
jgi:hypothetical protein